VNLDGVGEYVAAVDFCHVGGDLLSGQCPEDEDH
jgi:hypothetical protein